jgi:hypothetical protein
MAAAAPSDDLETIEVGVENPPECKPRLEEAIAGMA